MSETSEAYKQRFVDWDNAPRDEWGIARTPDGGVLLLPETPGQVGTWRTREEKEKASDLWWEKYKKKATATQRTAQLLRERNEQLGGR